MSLRVGGGLGNPFDEDEFVAVYDFRQAGDALPRRLSLEEDAQLFARVAGEPLGHGNAVFADDEDHVPFLERAFDATNPGHKKALLSAHERIHRTVVDDDRAAWAGDRLQPPLLPTRSRPAVKERSHSLPSEKAAESPFACAQDDEVDPHARGDARRFELCPHTSRSDDGPRSFRERPDFRREFAYLRDQARVRVQAGIFVVQALHVREKGDEVGGDGAGERGGERVVVANEDFLDGHGIVLVDDGENPMPKKRLQGVGQVDIAPPVDEVVAREQDLPYGEAAFGKAFRVGLHEQRLTDGGRRLLLRKREEVAPPAEAESAEGNRSRRNEDYLVPAVYGVGDVRHHLFEFFVAEFAPLVRKAVRSHLDHDASVRSAELLAHASSSSYVPLGARRLLLRTFSQCSASPKARQRSPDVETRTSRFHLRYHEHKSSPPISAFGQRRYGVSTREKHRLSGHKGDPEVDVFFSFFWLFFLLTVLLPMLHQRRIELQRTELMRRLEKKRHSRVITLIHRQEALSFLGIPITRYIDIEDSEHVLRAIRLTSPDMPIDLILHTPGGLVLAAEQIAYALAKHPAKVTVFVPHYAMSGGTLIALAADEIVMDENAVLGPVDPQLGEYPAASILKVLEAKPLESIDDRTLILADVAQKALRQVRTSLYELLRRKMPEEKAEALARLLSEGWWTHDYPIGVEELRSLGFDIRTDLPPEIYRLMELYPQPAGRRPSVQYIPLPYEKPYERPKSSR